MDEEVRDILQVQSQMESQRAVFDSHYQEIAERCLPRQDDFGRKGSEGEKRTDKIFDSTAVLAVDRAASAIESLITPATQLYHRLDPEHYDLMDDHEIRLFLDKLNMALFRMRYRPIANFPSQSHECYVSLMAFGTDALFIDDALGIGTRYKSIPMSELYIAENFAGIIDMVHRKFEMSVRAAYQKWGDKLPENITRYLGTDPLRKFEFLHCVKPNEDIDPKRKDWRGMKFLSYYISVEGGALLDKGGYRTMPYAVGRHVTAPREVYGRSPAMQVLADIKMVNEMEKTIIRAAHKIVDPPMLLYGDGILSSFNSRPNALNYGGVDDQGRQLVIPMKTGSNLPIAFEMAEQKRKAINDAFYVTLFQVLVENPRMTATEAMIRAQEKGQLLAPTVGRQQTEFLGAIVERELDIFMSANPMLEIPEKLLQTGGRIKVTYTSPLTRLRRAEDGTAIMRTLEAITPLAQINPALLDNFDDEAIARELADINGVPAKMLRAPEAIQAIREKREKEKAMQMAASMAQQVAGAAKDMGAAEGLANAG